MRSMLKMSDNYADIKKVFNAFNDVIRLQILEILRKGNSCSFQMLDMLDIGQSTLSYHLKILVESGVVASESRGKWTHYNINENGSKYALKLLKEITGATNNKDT